MFRHPWEKEMNRTQVREAIRQEVVPKAAEEFNYTTVYRFDQTEELLEILPDDDGDNAAAIWKNPDGTVGITPRWQMRVSAVRPATRIVRDHIGFFMEMMLNYLQENPLPWDLWGGPKDGDTLSNRLARETMMAAIIRSCTQGEETTLQHFRQRIEEMETIIAEHIIDQNTAEAAVGFLQSYTERAVEPNLYQYNSYLLNARVLEEAALEHPALTAIWWGEMTRLQEKLPRPGSPGELAELVRDRLGITHEEERILRSMEPQALLARSRKAEKFRKRPEEELQMVGRKARIIARACPRVHCALIVENIWDMDFRLEYQEPEQGRETGADQGKTEETRTNPYGTHQGVLDPAFEKVLHGLREGQREREREEKKRRNLQLEKEWAKLIRTAMREHLKDVWIQAESRDEDDEQGRREDQEFFCLDDNCDRIAFDITEVGEHLLYLIEENEPIPRRDWKTLVREAREWESNGGWDQLRHEDDREEEDEDDEDEDGYNHGYNHEHEEEWRPHAPQETNHIWEMLLKALAQETEHIYNVISMDMRTQGGEWARIPQAGWVFVSQAQRVLGEAGEDIREAASGLQQELENRDLWFSYRVNGGRRAIPRENQRRLY